MTDADRKFVLDIFDKVVLLLPALGAFFYAYRTGKRADERATEVEKKVDKTQEKVNETHENTQVNARRIEQVANGETTKKIVKEIERYDSNPDLFRAAMAYMGDVATPEEKRKLANAVGGGTVQEGGEGHE